MMNLSQEFSKKGADTARIAMKEIHQTSSSMTFNIRLNSDRLMVAGLPCAVVHLH